MLPSVFVIVVVADVVAVVVADVVADVADDMQGEAAAFNGETETGRVCRSNISMCPRPVATRVYL